MPLTGHNKCIEKLLEYRADINQQDLDGDSPLILATSMQHTDTIRLLIQHQADLNVKNRIGQCALDKAAFRGQIQAVRELILAGTSPKNHKEIYLNIESQEICELYFAAGFKLPKKVPEVLKQYVDCPGVPSLKFRCRQRIRNHLFNVNHDSNLFVLVKELGLPGILQSYLLYYIEPSD